MRERKREEEEAREGRRKGKMHKISRKSMYALRKMKVRVQIINSD